MKKAYIYCRFSPRRNGDKCQSNEVQLAYCRKYCEQHGYEIAGVFEDREASGDDEQRPGLWTCIASIKRGGVLVAHKHDRLARSVYLDECIRRAIKKKGATIEVVDGHQEGDSPHDVLVRQIFAAVSEFEKKVIAARTKAAVLLYQSQGRAMSKLPPYGKTRVGKFLVDDAEEIQNIERIRELWDDGDMSLHGIARYLNEQGEHNRGRKWTHKPIQRILRRLGVETGKKA